MANPDIPEGQVNPISPASVSLANLENTYTAAETAIRRLMERKTYTGTVLQPLLDAMVTSIKDPSMFAHPQRLESSNLHPKVGFPIPGKTGKRLAVTLRPNGITFSYEAEDELRVSGYKTLAVVKFSGDYVRWSKSGGREWQSKATVIAPPLEKSFSANLSDRDLQDAKAFFALKYQVAPAA